MTKFDRGFAKVTSMSADTNVISDLFALALYEAKIKLRYLDADEKEHFQRCLESKKSIYLMLDFDIERAGLKVVYRELLEKPPLHLIYKKIFAEEIGATRESKSLAEKYISKVGLDVADAMIVAMASENGIDVLLTWNRRHLSNPSSQAQIEEINRQHGWQTPALLTPTEFRSRLIRSDKRTFGLSPSPVLPVHHVDFYLSKRGV